MYYQPDIETMPREQLRELQLERMKQSVRHAYDNVAFYQQSFKEAGVTLDDLQALEDLERLPFVVKQDMRDAYPFGLFAVPQKDVARIHASSGTTGQATVVRPHASTTSTTGASCFARGMIAMAGGDENSTIQVSYGYGLFTGGLGAHAGGRGHGLLGHPHLLGQHATAKCSMLQGLRHGPSSACTPSATPCSSRTPPSRWAIDPATEFKISARHLRRRAVRRTTCARR